MASTKQKQKKRTIEYKNAKYICTSRNGKVVVKTTRTAHGQQQIAGVLDIAERTWQRGNKGTPLPKHVKAEVEKIF